MATRGRSVLVIGGGIAGPAAGVALRRAGFDVEVCEAHPDVAEDVGSYLGMAPNGLAALDTLGVGERVRGAGIYAECMRFFNARGRMIAETATRGDSRGPDHRNLMIKRNPLHRILVEQAGRAGVRVSFGRRLVGLDTHAGGGAVTARFADGSEARGDVLLGCDGLRSAVRRQVLPDAPPPQYTGIINTGGFARLPPGAVPPGVQHFVFGRRAFFGYIAQPDGEVWWFSNLPRESEPTRGQTESADAGQFWSMLVEQHRGDPDPVPRILAASRGVVGTWPDYAMPPLRQWHRGRVCLLGDAAHATPPHAGQGASLALEDALVMAKCLRDVEDVDAAFATFQSLRKARAESIVAAAKRVGSRKMPGPVGGFFRDLTLPAFIRLATRQAAATYAYRVDWDEAVFPAPCRD